MIEGQAVDFPYQISVTNGQVHALHVLFPVSVIYNGVGYERMRAASDRIRFPTVPEVASSNLVAPATESMQ